MLDFTAFYLVTQDDFCLEESCQSLKSQGVKKFVFCMPKTYWDGTALATLDVQRIKHLAEKFNAALHEVDVPNLKPLSAREAAIRNTMIKMIGGHVLIVDADEWWAPGRLKELETFIMERMSEATTINAVDVIGLPGYPVKSKSEGLLVHVYAPSVMFTYGRSTDVQPKACKCGGVYHFTATRRTTREIMVKNRRSCHYDDPDYDFNGWNANVLPHIKPGLKNCHMFKRWVVWDEVRAFTLQEWGVIPPSLKQYLGKPI